MKSHFTFSKEQRNGILLLLILIIGLQCLYFFVVPITIGVSSEDIAVNKEELAKFNKEIDSLRLVQLEQRKPKIHPFNPNYITDFKGASLGMSNKEIDRLLAFRKENNWINSTKQFQEVTKVSDSFLNQISPYFKFPEWVNKPKVKQVSAFSYGKTSKTYVEKQDLNKATPKQLQSVNGVGTVFSERIVKFRNKFIGGFIDDIQLQDVYGLTPEIIEKITNHFIVKTPRQIQKININNATVDNLVTVQHIDYDLAYNIIEQRNLRDGYKSLDELIKVKDFPVNKIDIIKLYLSLD
ncbi:helix-hairpin-helix domain-containing protein [Flavivirga aquimarina]|uniref:Helix-hairpin-helix domain-containing protein n=1 Tax=Flavivirga aquimarina TaxID=2027862 RepID=A0ABT8WD50_9FLAO|nr:helix-hairpin-helix domain-containing protein [Flavivirga aquimarina]MDO5970947.1 helix-hairpin-helix domain-containing protein [Flavivirga aquimarina]